MTLKDKVEARNNGATYQQIADECGISRQAVHQSVTHYDQRIKKRVRGRGFLIEKIKYKGIYEHFIDDETETLSSFTFGVYGDRVHCSKMSHFLKGEHDSHFKIAQIKKLCEICGKPFEEVFSERTPTEKGGDQE